MGHRSFQKAMSGRFCILVLGLCWKAASAQSLTVPAKVSYQRDVPKNVAHAIPMGAKRLFWGTFVPQTGDHTFGIQIYDFQAVLTLEMWEKSLKRFTRINCVPGLYNYQSTNSQSMPSSAKFSAEYYWLDKVQKTTPILVITQITSGKDNLMPGEYRSLRVVSLSGGWKGKPRIQAFDKGDSNAGVDGFSVKYNNAGKLNLYSSTGNGHSLTTDTYTWDGQQFSLGKRVVEPVNELDG